MIAFAFTAWLAGVILPPPEMPTTIREKLAHLAAHGGEYDAIFIGSSRIQTHLMPQIFDPLVGSSGLPMKSFNAGVASMRTPEDGWFLDQILVRRPARLRWVFLELDYFQTELQDDQQGTVRGVAWHDGRRAWQLLRRHLVLEHDLDWRDPIAACCTQLRDFIQHLSGFGQRATQLGRAAVLYDRWRHQTPPDPMDWRKLGESGDGWTPSEHAGSPSRKTVARLAALIDEKKGDRPKPHETDRVTQAVLGETIGRIIRAGAVPILIIPPRAREYYLVPSAENARRAHVIDLCDPDRYPELYEARNRIDTSHLNAAGAEVFTRLVAARFLEIASGKSAPLSPLPPAAR